jgi:hypothetical protein
MHTPLQSDVPITPANKKAQAMRTAFKVDLSCRQFSLIIGISSRAWVYWLSKDIYVHAAQSEAVGAVLGEYVNGGLRIGSQEAGFSRTKIREPPSRAPGFSNALRIPRMAAIGSISVGEDEIRVRGSLSMDPFVGTFKPTVLDRLLSTYKALGHDVRAFILFSETLLHRKRGAPLEVATSRPPPARRLLYSLKVESKGIRVNLRASRVSSLLVIQATSIGGWVTNCGADLEASLTAARPLLDYTTWDVNVSGLRLSTGVLTGAGGKVVTETAFMVLDVGLTQRPPSTATAALADMATSMHVQARLANARAVMQVTALGQVYDLLESWSADMRSMRERRAEEWTDIVQETSKFMKPELKPSPAERLDWLEKHAVSLEIEGLAIAIPLSLEQVSNLEQKGSMDDRHEPLPALLFSISKISAINRRGEVGRADVKDLMLQFVRE